MLLDEKGWFPSLASTVRSILYATANPHLDAAFPAAQHIEIASQIIMTKTHLMPANQNPWYILMTLHGEQLGDQIDWDLHRRNSTEWNRWIGSRIDPILREELREAGVLISSGTSTKDSETFKKLYTEVFARRNGTEKPLPEIPSASSSIDLSDFRLDNIFSCRGFQFNSSVDITNCEFQKAADFSEAVFADGMGIKHACFLDELRFDGSYYHKPMKIGKSDFKAGVSMTKCRFASTFSISNSTKFFEGLYAGGSEFSGYAELKHCHFRNGSDFAGCEFKRSADFGASLLDEATFQNSEFKANVSFIGTIFTQGAAFNEAKFRELVQFSAATFNQGADFRGAIFDKHVYFTNGNFAVANETFQDRVSFQDCTFLGPVSFKKANFKNVYPDFTGVSLPDTATFSTGREYWPDKTHQAPEQVVESCAAIRHHLAKQGLPEEEHFFFRREMNFRALVGGWPQRFLFFLYRNAASYGHSIARPSLWLAAVWLIGFAMFWGYFSGCCYVQPTKNISSPFSQAFGLSFANLFPLFGFHRLYFGADFMKELPASLRFFSSVQTVVSLPLLFLLGLGIRQRFRLK